MISTCNWPVTKAHAFQAQVRSLYHFRSSWKCSNISLCFCSRIIPRIRYSWLLTDVSEYVTKVGDRRVGCIAVKGWSGIRCIGTGGGIEDWGEIWRRPRSWMFIEARVGIFTPLGQVRSQIGCLGWLNWSEKSGVSAMPKPVGIRVRLCVRPISWYRSCSGA